MRHLFRTTRRSDWMALLVLPAWLASGCENDSIRLGGWNPVPAPPASAPPAAAAPAPAPAPPGQPLPPEREPPPGRAESDAYLPEGVAKILGARCTECHVYGLRDPAGWGSVLDISRMIDSEIVVPGNLESSRMWYRVAVRSDMPFNGTRLTPEEKGVLQQWILGLQRSQPRPRTQAEILDLLVNDGAAAGSPSDVRYVSFADFVDGRRPAVEIATAAAVFKVVLNSVSRQATFVEPVAVDRQASIWRFRLSDLGWNEQDWNRFITFYPYCLRSEAAAHQALYQRLHTETPVVRGDWFLSTALAPAVYHDLLQLGDNLDQIARRNLGVDINQNIARGDVVRLASQSGATFDGSVLERHETRRGGYLWLTYHLAPGEDVRRLPLGPRNRNDDFPNSFTAVATEAVWSLPNGLQAYLLTDGAGNRVDSLSTAVAADPRRRNGQMETATACNGCHGTTGLIPPRAIDVGKYADEHSADFSPAERAQINRLYPRLAETLLASDAAQYRQTVGELLGAPLPQNGAIEWYDFVNLRGQYESKLGLRQVALELGTGPTVARMHMQSNLGARLVTPWSLTEPLIAREDWICQFRRIARQTPGTNLCTGTFTAPDLTSFCDRQDAGPRP
jgi:mono/diheme cytochrome c family protein